MKIVIDARLYGPENTGIGRYVTNLLKNLERIDNRNSYTILLRKKYFNQLNFKPNWRKLLVDFRHYSFSEQLHLPKILNKLDADLIHFPHFNVPLFYSGNFVVTIHDILMHKQKGFDATTLPPVLYLIKRLGYKPIFRHAVKGALKVIVPSNYVKNSVSEFYGLDKNKVVVAYEGVDEKVMPSGTTGSTLKKYSLISPYFIYTGNAYPHKNLKRLIEAVCLLNQKRKESAKLAIVSARNYFTDKLKKLVVKLNATSFVNLLGYVPDGELGVLLRNSAGFVFPSLSEGFGLPGLEAMSCGTMVAASDIPVLKEVYAKHALYFNPYDYTSIEKAMEDVLDLEIGLRKERIESAKEYAKRYSWDKMARETLKVYASCAGLRSR